jgi:hypothetical protein
MIMAGFRLWEHVTIEEMLSHLHDAVLSELQREGIEVSGEARERLLRAIKKVLNEDMYASPACGTSSLCRPHEEGRAKPWSYQAAMWGLISQADLSLERE